MPLIYVCSARALPEQVALVRPNHLISLGAPVDTPSLLGRKNHLLLKFADLVEITPRNAIHAPTTQHIEKLIEFGDQWNAKAPMMINCFMGQSRSPAAAYIILCLKNPGKERACAELLRKRAPYCMPNLLMVKIADEILARRNRMTDAIEGLGKPTDLPASRVFSVPATVI